MAARRLIFSIMRLLDRYLFCELLTPLAFCLVGIQGFVIFFTAFNELGEMQERKLHLWDSVAYSILSATSFLTVVLPVSLLVALLIALANHARHNEITAMRAAGVGLWRICAPYFVVGLIASAALFALDEFLVPRCTDWSWQIKTRYVHKADDPDRQNDFRNFGFNNARENRTWIIGEYRLKTSEMLNPKVIWNLPDGSSHRLYADRAIRTNGGWTFFNVTEYLQADTNAPLVPSLQTNELARPDFDETPSQIRSEIKISGYLSPGGARQADIPLKDIFDYLRLHPNLPPDSANQLFTKFYGRLAAPWTCLVVVLIAIPFGAASGRRNLFFGVAGSIFICFTFFVVQQVSLVLGSGGHLPAWLAAWLPNMIFGAMGLILTARVR
jgi:lipopolysaccharide export system permease protein